LTAFRPSFAGLLETEYVWYYGQKTVTVWNSRQGEIISAQLTRTARMAAKLFGIEVARARRERGWTAAELAERAGISRSTLHKVESGDPSVALGTAFEVAALLNVMLYGVDRRDLTDLVARSQDRLALLPARVRKPVEVANDF
jgi:DNA-binding XRE family transcriptional regulator